MNDKSTILDEFVAITGTLRKHATRVLGAAPGIGHDLPVHNRLYDEAVRQALVLFWKAGDRICGKRLKPLIPVLVDAMERHRHLDLDPVVKARLRQISAATGRRQLSWPVALPHQFCYRWYPLPHVIATRRAVRPEAGTWQEDGESA